MICPYCDKELKESVIEWHIDQNGFIETNRGCKHCGVYRGNGGICVSIIGGWYKIIENELIVRNELLE